MEGRITVRQASQLLSVSPSQVNRLKQRYDADDPEWVHHGNRGSKREWALSKTLQRKILALGRNKYAGFNDNHLTEKLQELEGIAVSRESVRRILRRAGVRSPQKRRFAPSPECGRLPIVR